MTPFSIAYCIKRLNEVAHDAALLKARWANFGVFPQNHPEIRAHKDRLKARLLK